MATKYQGSKEEIQALNTYIKLQRAADTVFNHTNGHLSKHGLTTSQFGVLEALYHLGALSQRDLAEKLLKSTGNMSIVLKNMEKKGWIERHRDPQDNRYNRVCISEVGRSLIAAIFPAHVAGIVAEMSVLTTDEQETLACLCRKLGLRQA